MRLNEVDDFGFTETGFGSKLYGESWLFQQPNSYPDLYSSFHDQKLENFTGEN